MKEKNFDELLIDLDTANEERQKLLIEFTVKWCYKIKDKFPNLKAEDLDKLEELIFESFKDMKDKNY